MNRAEYLQQLKIALQGLPNDDLQDILYDYEEHFDIGLSKGKSEEEISQELGDPQDIANNYKSSFKNYQNETVYNSNNSSNNSVRTLLIVLALGFFNLVIVLGPFLGIVGGLIGLYGGSVGILAGGLGSFFGAIIGPLGFFNININFHPLTGIAFGIALTSLGILGLLLCVYLTKLLYKGAIKYIQWNLDLIKR